MIDYEWTGYDIDGEIVCGGNFLPDNDDEAKAKVEKELEENYEEYAEAGYFKHQILKFGRYTVK